jgi:hypothetical protein
MRRGHRMTHRRTASLPVENNRATCHLSHVTCHTTNVTRHSLQLTHLHTVTCHTTNVTRHSLQLTHSTYDMQTLNDLHSILILQTEHGDPKI